MFDFRQTGRIDRNPVRALRNLRRERAADPNDDRDYYVLMRIAVECYSGYRGEQEPRAFTLGARRFEVRELVDRWLHPAHRYFKVRVDDGRQFILRHDGGSGEWELAGLVGPGSTTSGDGITRH